MAADELIHKTHEFDFIPTWYTNNGRSVMAFNVINCGFHWRAEWMDDTRPFLSRAPVVFSSMDGWPTFWKIEIKSVYWITWWIVTPRSIKIVFLFLLEIFNCVVLPSSGVKRKLCQRLHAKSREEVKVNVHHAFKLTITKTLLSGRKVVSRSRYVHFRFDWR